MRSKLIKTNYALFEEEKVFQKLVSHTLTTKKQRTISQFFNFDHWSNVNKRNNLLDFKQNQQSALSLSGWDGQVDVNNLEMSLEAKTDLHLSIFF